jgi:FtsP/CotA-like multicopper oxidase with cupredoxin domain
MGSHKNKNFKRREFIKLTASGVAVTLSGCSTSDTKLPAAKLSGIIDPELALAETWQEPWVWRPEQWPDAALDLNVVLSQNPGLSPSPGNPGPMLFSFNGTSPGPTIRVRNDGVLKIKIRNTLGLNEALTHVGPSPDPVDLTQDVEREVCALAEEQLRGGDPENPRRCNPFFFPEQLLQVISPEVHPGWSFKGHVNGRHAAHTTNLHTHGLHVFPQTNPDGSYSDDVHLRIIPQADWEARQASDDPELHSLAHHEHVGSLDYKMLLPFKRNGQLVPHPPGTHWYHPHSHGSTHDQVASGMAGFLIVEGDVDDAINVAMTGEKKPDPMISTGRFDYRERLIFVQRVMVLSTNQDAGPKRDVLREPPPIAVNGARSPGFIRMRPGTVERWRVLNGSVDGAGTKRFMVLDGHYIHKNGKLWRVTSEGEEGKRTQNLEVVSEQEIEDSKLDLHQL